VINLKQEKIKLVNLNIRITPAQKYGVEQKSNELGFPQTTIISMAISDWLKSNQKEVS